MAPSLRHVSHAEQGAEAFPSRHVLDKSMAALVLCPELSAGRVHHELFKYWPLQNSFDETLARGLALII